jgi:hypothetical protein
MKRKIIILAVLLVVVAVIFGVLPMSVGKRRVPSGSIVLLDVGHLVFAYGTLKKASLLLTNMTSRAILVENVAVETEPGKWMFSGNPPMIIFPHNSAAVSLWFDNAAAPVRPWRFKLKVGEELKGPERALMAGQYGVRRFVGRMNNRPTPNPYARGTNYFGHQTEMVIGEDQDWPKMPGDRSAH